MLVTAALAGLLIGLALGLLGAGGSILAVPALVYVAAQPLSAAVPTSLLVVGASAAAAVVPRLRAGIVHWPVVLIFGAAGIPATIAGATLGQLMPPRLRLLGFAVVMTVVALRMSGEPAAAGPAACQAKNGPVSWKPCLPLALSAGALVGVLTGLFGVGGGFLIVPALTLLLGINASAAVATSLVIITVNSVAGLIAHTNVALDWAIVGNFAGAAVLAALGAGALATRLPVRTVRRAFVYAVLVLAVATAVTAVVAPATVLAH